MGICYMTREGSVIVEGWNMDKDGNMWITTTKGNSKKIAEGAFAIKLYDEFCRIAESQFPCVLREGDKFLSNINTEIEVEA